MATPMAQNIKKLTARLIGTLIFMIDGQNMKQLTARVITDQVDIGALILMIDDHNIETHCKGDQVEANTGGDHSP